MKTILFILIFTSVVTYGQFTQGTKEIALSFSASQHSYKVEGFTSGDNESKMLYLSLMPSYYLTQGLSVEPEISVAINDESAPGHCIIANISYTAKLENTNTALFVRGGYGLSNGLYYPMLRGLLYRSRDEMDVGILNLGVGIKLFAGSNAYFRIEANYKSQSYEDEFPVYSYPYYYSYHTETKKIQSDDVSVTVGLGLLF